MEYEHARNMTLLFFLERLLDKGEPRTLHDLSCQFGARGFTREMRQIAGGSQSGHLHTLIYINQVMLAAHLKCFFLFLHAHFWQIFAITFIRNIVLLKYNSALSIYFKFWNAVRFIQSITYLESM